jgi:hypothetical protein
MAGVGNTDNLRPPTTDEARERGRKGGLASGEARRQQKTMAQALKQLLYDGKLNETTKQMLKSEGIEEMTHQMVITRSLIAKAEAGDVQAYNTICAMIGEKPADNLNIGGVPTNLTIHMIGDNGYQFPSKESEIDLTREKKQDD